MAVASYKVEDRSILLPYLKRFFVGPLLERLPLWVAPNTLTLTAFLLSTIAIMLVVSPVGPAPVRFILAAPLVWAYVVLDNADGAQARRTGRASPLGEFLDHWLDSFTAGYLCLGASIALGVSMRYAIPLLAAGQFAYYASIWEQRNTGRLILGRTSQIEACALLAMVYVLTGVLGPGWAKHEIAFGVTAMDFFCGWQAVTFGAVVLSCAYRTRKDFLPLFAHGALFALYGVWGYAHADGAGWLVFALVLANVATSGHTLITRLLDQRLSAIDAGHAIVVATGATLAVLQHPASFPLSQALVAYLTVLVLRDGWSAMRTLRKHLDRRELLGRIFVRH